jgi:tartrate dehydrogenase/decarboxylase/D-malate dehydrogenase
MSKTFRIAAIPGDGIGKEVMPEGLRVLEAAARRFDVDLKFTHIDWASCDHYAKTGAMMPADWKAQLEGWTRSISARSAGRRRCPTTSRCGARC